MASRDFSHSEFRLLGFVYQHGAGLVKSVVAETAPCPLFRFEHQSALYRVAVHITQFFHPLFLAEHDKVIEAALPDVACFQRRAPQLPLPGVGARTQLAEQTPRKTLFESLHHQRWIGAQGFSHQKVYVFGHHHVANDHKMIATPDPFEYLQKQIAIRPGAEQGEPMVTTGGDKVQVSSSVVAVESVGHADR
jgi:hypothetical protein